MGDVHEALKMAADALQAAGIEEARFDAEVLLEHATGWDLARLAANPEEQLPGEAARRFGELVRRRLRREPVAYILGVKWFRRIELAVDPRVLIPRPETELLVELAVELRPRTALDVGTGSGAVALAIAAELPECRVVATDTSAAALEVARANAERLGSADRVRFLEGTIPGTAGRKPGGAAATAAPSPPASESSPTTEPSVTATEPAIPARLDLIVANLPYVAEPDWGSLAPEVSEWEPREALLAGPEGLDAIGAFVRDLRRSPPHPRGGAAPAVALEVGEGQAAAVATMLREAGFGNVQTRRDLAGIERVVWGRR